ncbi:MAG: PDZ domain-containing protein, partial [Anaerolineales bacterium]
SKPFLYGWLLLKEIYDLQPLCKPKDYAWFGVVAANQAGNVVIESFEPGSPAEQAGLEIGDLIYWLGDHYMESADQIYKLLDNYQPGNQIVVSGFRSSSGESFEIEVTLSQRPE